MNTNAVLLTVAGLVFLSSTSQDQGNNSSDSFTPIPVTTTNSIPAILASAPATQAFENIANTYGTQFAAQLETAVANSSNAAEVFAQFSPSPAAPPSPSLLTEPRSPYDSEWYLISHPKQAPLPENQKIRVTAKNYNNFSADISAIRSKAAYSSGERAAYYYTVADVMQSELNNWTVY